MNESRIFNGSQARSEIKKEKLERVPASEEVRSLFEKIIGEEKYEDVRKLEDKEGLYLLEVKITKEDGSIEYSYIRKGDYRSRGLAGGSAAETAIHITYFNNDGIPISGHSLFKLINDRWTETP